MLLVNDCNMSIARFGFLAIFILYLVLLLAEYLRPGFVATSGNVHWLWVAMVLWVAIDIGLKRFWFSRMLNSNDGEDDRTSIGGAVWASIFPIAFGILLGLIVWHVGETFGGMRLLFAIVAAVVPFILVRSTRID